MQAYGSAVIRKAVVPDDPETIAREIRGMKSAGCSLIVARAQGPGAQKASAGLALILEARTGIRRMGRADRATGRSPLQGNEAFMGGENGCPPLP